MPKKKIIGSLMQEMQFTRGDGIRLCRNTMRKSNTGQRHSCPQATVSSWVWFLPALQERGWLPAGACKPVLGTGKRIQLN